MDMITPQPRAAWIAGRPEQGTDSVVVHHPYDGSEVATVAVPGAEAVRRAVAGAVTAAPTLRRLPAHQRAAVLRQVAVQLAGQVEDVAEAITAESGVPLRAAEAEVRRAVELLTTAVDEVAEREAGLRRLDHLPSAEGRLALHRRVPRGPVLVRTPCVGALELAAEAVGAALAAGAPVLLAPSPAAPMSVLLLGEILTGAELPEGAFSVLPLAAPEATALAEDPRLGAVWQPGAAGSPFGTTAIVLDDWPDPEGAAERIALSGNQLAGQSRVAVGPVVVQRRIAAEFLPALAEAVDGLRTGDPYDTAVQVGPMVDEEAAERMLAWVREAVASGANLLRGGQREGTTVAPALLTDVAPGTAVPPGPVLTVSVVDDIDEAIAAANAAGHLLCAGLFSTDLHLAFHGSAELDTDRLLVGDLPDGAGDGIADGVERFTTRRVTVLTGLEL